MTNWLDNKNDRDAATSAAWAIANNMGRWMKLEEIRRDKVLEKVVNHLMDSDDPAVREWAHRLMSIV